MDKEYGIMARQYLWLSLSEIAKYEPEMRRLKVSVVARSRGGFFYYYKQVTGPLSLSWNWHNRRRGFVARHLAQYKKNPTYRRWLSLVCWAYKPDGRFE